MMFHLPDKSEIPGQVLTRLEVEWEDIVKKSCALKM